MLTGLKIVLKYSVTNKALIRSTDTMKNTKNTVACLAAPSLMRKQGSVGLKGAVADGTTFVF